MIEKDSIITPLKSVLVVMIAATIALSLLKLSWMSVACAGFTGLIFITLLGVTLYCLRKRPDLLRKKHE